MSKRQRMMAAELVQITTEGKAVIEYDGKQYSWNIPSDINIITVCDTSQYEMTIIHNNEHRAMIDIVNVRTEEIYLRQEVNPIAYKDVDEWVVDK